MQKTPQVTIAGFAPKIGNCFFITICAFWGISSLLMGTALLMGREQNILHVIGMLGGTGYIIALIVALLRSSPYADELPDVGQIVSLPKSYEGMLTLITLLCGSLFFTTGILWKNGWLMLPFCFAIALFFIALFRKEITRRMILGGLTMGFSIFLVEQIMNFNPQQALYLSLGIIPLSIAGFWLLERSRLSAFHLLGGDYRSSAKSFGLGCVLAIPPALLNVIMALGSEPSEFDLMFDRWWKAFYAFQPGILEEAWARLFLTTFLYVLLRPVGAQRPRHALAAVILLATLMHGLAHYPASISEPISAVFISLMYGIPLTLLYIKRDFEHAVAYHFFIDFVRFGVAALFSS